MLNDIEQARARYPRITKLLLKPRSFTSIPRALIENRDLPPAAKIVWMVLATHGSASVHGMPKPGELIRLANVATRSTLIAALLALRITRWMTVTKIGGAKKSTIYTLHSIPLPMADAIEIDVRYREILAHARTDRLKLIRLLADQAISELSEGRERKENPRIGVPDPSALKAGDRRWDFVRAQRSATRVDPQAQRRALKLHTTGDIRPAEAKRMSADPLLFPQRWVPEQVRLARKHLRTVPVHQRQAVLDELEGRVRSVTLGAAPVFNELRFFKRLCETAKKGEFEANLGGPIRSRRDLVTRHRSENHRPRPAVSKRTDEDSRLVAEALSELRKTLGK